MGKGRISLSKRVKNSVKSAVKFINKFEETAAEIAIRNGYEYVVCGHIHQPSKRLVKRDGGQVLYLNSGDWVENCTALEYNRGGWHIHWQDEVPDARNLEMPLEMPVHASELFKELLREFAVK
jgi:UDP-2,3-diacylglucosamine pyrophosphatase LpxH